MGKVRQDCRWPYLLTGKIEHCPIDSGKLLKCFKKSDALFKIMFQKVGLVPLGRVKDLRVKLWFGRAHWSIFH